MSHLFYMVKEPLTNGMRPDEMRRADEFAGCDLQWLESQGAVVGVGTNVPGFNPITAPPNTTDPQALQSTIIQLQQQLAQAVAGNQGAHSFVPSAAPNPPQGFPMAQAGATRLPTPETMADARRLQAAMNANATQQDNTVKPVTRHAGQIERLPANPPLYPDRPGAVSFDLTPVLKRIDETREALVDEIRRYAGDEGTSAARDSERERLAADLKAAQDVSADLAKQLQAANARVCELESANKPQPAPTQQAGPQPAPPSTGPAPGSVGPKRK